ncbi:MAG TPA: metallophosphoesterase [Thermoanaerobaculia bacterium]|nr:metallophosphoesterase [Thermoanaerobaculia bacterium]
MDPVDRRKFFQFAGMTLGAGALFRFAPPARGEEGGLMDALDRSNGERPAPFSFVQFSDTHVGFSGDPDPLGTKAFERAVETVNALRETPDLVLFTGDLTHDSEKPGEHAARMKRFREIAANLKAPLVKCVPGEHDAGLDGGTLFRENFGETHYSFDHRGVHFVGLDNVSLGKPAVGREQLVWLQKDLERFPKTAPIVVFTHRPLFDLKPDWEWFTSDGDQVMNTLAPYENVTVLYGHIHREHVHEQEHATHYASRSLIFAFPDPETGVPKKPVAFDPAKPFQNLGLRRVGERPPARPSVELVELTLREYAGTVGIQQLQRKGEES